MCGGASPHRAAFLFSSSPRLRRSRLKGSISHQAAKPRGKSVGSSLPGGQSPPSHQAAKPPSHRAAKPPSHRAAKPRSHRAAKPRSHRAGKAAVTSAGKAAVTSGGKAAVTSGGKAAMVALSTFRTGGGDANPCAPETTEPPRSLCARPLRGRRTPSRPEAYSQRTRTAQPEPEARTYFQSHPTDR